MWSYTNIQLWHWIWMWSSGPLGQWPCSCIDKFEWWHKCRVWMAARAGSIHLVMDLLKYCCYSPRFGHARAHHAQFPIFNKRRRRKLYSGVKHNTLLSMKPLMLSTQFQHITSTCLDICCDIWIFFLTRQKNLVL